MGYDDDMARAGVADAPGEGFALLKPQTSLSSYVRMRFHWICRQVNAGGLRFISKGFLLRWKADEPLFPTK